MNLKIPTRADRARSQRNFILFLENDLSRTIQRITCEMTKRWCLAWRVAHPEFLKSKPSHKFGCPILSAASSRKGWEPRIPTNGPGKAFSGYGEVGPLRAERPDVKHDEPQPAMPTAPPPKTISFSTHLIPFPVHFFCFLNPFLLPKISYKKSRQFAVN